MKENSNTDCVVNVKSIEISNELGQSLPRFQIYRNFAQNSESESLLGRYKRVSSKVDFNTVRDPNGKSVCFFNFVIQVLYSLPVFKDYINKIRPPVKGVAMKVKNFLVK